ncbi:DUF6881 domain-containing protein [Zavarzinia compransoris]|uniref:DUF6881 domain-containing protein n=1 Tax=Zavarzinia compransoris TaxID=1264899 RepID=UPI00105E4D2C|nr:hypothetical protein [Zavarzinia compransoris]
MNDFSYIHVRWLHSSSDFPVDLWCELDADRQEVRKVEIWLDGRVGYVSLAGGTRDTELSQDPVPSMEDLDLDPEFQAEAITKADFETCWIDATGKT